MERLLEALQRLGTGEATVPSALVGEVVFWFGLFLIFGGTLRRGPGGFTTCSSRSWPSLSSSS
jgi:hypothetical protein